MYQKGNNSKVYPHSFIPKRESFQIAGWVAPSSHQPDIRIHKNKAKFSTIDYNRFNPSSTIVSESLPQPKRRPSTRSSDRKNDRTIRTTNFTYGQTSSRENSAFASISSFLDEQRPSNILSEKKKWLKVYHNQAIKRRI